MNDNFLYKLWQNFPNSWTMTFTLHKFELGTFNKICQILAEIFPALRIVHQQTLVSELDWLGNDRISQAEQTSPVTCVRWVVAGDELTTLSPSFVAQVKAQFSALNIACDVHVMPLSTLLIPKKLALFDMDSTLIEQEVIVELAKKAGIGEQVNIITEAAMRGEIDFSESFTRRVELLKGLSKDVLDDIIRDNITFSLGAKRLITALKQHGYHVVLVSGGFSYFAEYVKTELGIDEIYANELDFEDGKLTGNVTSPIVDGKRKAEILQEVAKRLNIDLSQTVAVGDGANDLPMLSMAGVGIAYRAKPIVQQQADFAINVAGLDGVLTVLGLA